jgi:hypothetical protein
VRLTKRPPVLQPRSKETSRKTDLRAKTGTREAILWATRGHRDDEGSTRGRPTSSCSGAVLSRAWTAAAKLSEMWPRVDAGTIEVAGTAAVALLLAGSTGVEAGTVTAAGAVTCMLTRELATCSTLSSGAEDASAWSASILLRTGERETFGGWSPYLFSSREGSKN